MSKGASDPSLRLPDIPPLALRCLARMAEDGERFSIIGDLEEEYARRAAAVGSRGARLWLWGQIFLSTPAHIKNRAIWRLQMFKNILKISVRNFRKHTAHSVINLLGLSIGLASCLLIYLWTQDALSFNRFHKNAGDLYRVYSELAFSNGSNQLSGKTSYSPLARFAKANCPEVLEAGRITESTRNAIKYQGKTLAGNEIMFLDPSMLKMFSFVFLRGDPGTALADRFSCLLTEDAARKIFGNEDPLGGTLTVDKADIRVTGVIKKFPRQSDYHADILLPFGLQYDSDRDDSDGMDKWGGNPLQTYVLLRPGIRPVAAARTLNSAFAQAMPKTPGMTMRFGLQPLGRIHIENPEGGGLIQFVPIFSLAAAFILLIACVNFVNLMTARAGHRAREVGLRKIVGARRGDLIRQFFGESLLLAFLALALALGLTWLLLPAFGKLVGAEVSFDIAFYGAASWKLAGVVLGVGLLAGGYPALVLSSFPPLKTMKSTSAVRTGGSVFRKMLVIAQFSISIFLIIATLGIARQLRYMKSKDLGFEREGILSVTMAGPRGKAFDAFKTEILRHPGVLNATRTFEHPANVHSSVWDAEWDGKNPNVRVAMGFMFVDYDFFETFRMTMVSGRTFSPDFATDLKKGYVINEAAAKAMGLSDPVGKRLSIFKQQGTIVGVVKDFHFKPLNFAVEPLVLGMDPGWGDIKKTVFISLAPGDVGGTIRRIEDIWKTMFPGVTFSYGFFNDRYKYFYMAETRMGSVISVFSALAVLVSCLGLFGLASFMAEQRTREIGIRKVLGASTSKIAVLLSKEFTKGVMAANLAAWPLAYFALRQWLKGYAARTSLNLVMFLAAGAAAFLIAILTVSWQSMRAARRDPVESIRYE